MPAPHWYGVYEGFTQDVAEGVIGGHSCQCYGLCDIDDPEFHPSRSTMDVNRLLLLPC